MKLLKLIKRDERGVAVIEIAIVLPVLILFIYGIFQIGILYQANAGMQHALGEGARAATLWPVPEVDVIEEKMEDAVYGIGPGTFDIVDPVEGTDDGTDFLDLTVTYTQPTDLLIFPGPTITVSRSKRVWVAESA